MANRFCNLDGNAKIKDEYGKINIGFDKVENEIDDLNSNINAVDNRVNEIITTPADGVSAQEIIDARHGKPTLGAKIAELDAHKADIVQTAEVNSSIKYPSSAVTYMLYQQIKTINAQVGGHALDLNEITEPFAVRRVDNSTLNIPANLGDGMCIHFAIGESCVQICCSYGLNNMFHRTKYGTWRVWKKVTSV